MNMVWIVIVLWKNLYLGLEYSGLKGWLCLVRLEGIDEDVDVGKGLYKEMGIRVLRIKSLWGKVTRDEFVKVGWIILV